ncbi:MAG: glycoside hydrolase family 13 protein [Muribaculaceae bacterium]
MIHKRLLLLAVAVATCVAAVAKDAVKLDFEPPFWWSGMNETSLQIMVHGEGVRDAATVVDTDKSGAVIDSVVRLDSPNYQLVYVNTAAVKPGTTLNFSFKIGKKTVRAAYEMRARDGKPHPTFDAADVLYLIMPDRFADGDPSNNVLKSMRFPVEVDRTKPNSRHGGDLKGIESHLGFIDSIGVTAIWLNPVLENDMPDGSYHGYATTDYYRVDPRFGTNEEYVALIAKAHDRGLKVVMDMIFNHSGSEHRWMHDMPSHDWYNHPAGDVMTNFRLSTINDPYVSDFDLDRSVNGWFVPSMPDLNQLNPHVMKYLIQNSIWWIEYSRIDGIRMDTYPYADMLSMASWIRAIHKEYPGYNVVGECWYGEAAGTAYWQDKSRLNLKGRTELPTVMDFPLMLIAPKAFSQVTLPWADGLNEIYNRLSLDYLYEDPQHVLTFLDNHDTDRFLPAMPENLRSWKQAVTFLLTSRGIPQIYYGTELLMFGDRKVADGCVRQDVPGGFPGDDHNEFTAAGRSALQNEAFDFISRIAHWRRGNDAIARGSLKHFMPSNGMYVYERKSSSRRAIVIMNGNDADADIDMSVYREIMRPGDTFTDVLTGAKVTIEPQMRFAPRATLLLE